MLPTGSEGNAGPKSPKTPDFFPVCLVLRGPWGLQAPGLANACVRIRKAPAMVYAIGPRKISQFFHRPRQLANNCSSPPADMGPDLVAAGALHGIFVPAWPCTPEFWAPNGPTKWFFGSDTWVG